MRIVSDTTAPAISHVYVNAGLAKFEEEEHADEYPKADINPDDIPF